MPLHITIRSECPTDAAAIAEVTREAFRFHPHSSYTEHFIIDALRSSNVLSISLVAEVNAHVVGHIAFSPVTVGNGSQGWYGLGPMAVKPGLQGRGIGQALVRNGLAAFSAPKTVFCSANRNSIGGSASVTARSSNWRA